MSLNTVIKSFALFLCPLFLFAQSVLAQSSEAGKIDTYINPFVEANQFSGVVLAIKNGQVIYEKSFGLANADFKIPNQANTRIGVASLTKLMTIVVANRLAETGKISFEDKLSKYIPDFPAGDKITIDTLINHRSGIPHSVTRPEEETISLTSEEIIEKIKKASLAFEPGTQRLYSSAGFAVLARTLEIASGKPYAALLEEYVFTPAGMKDSLDYNGERVIERRAQDYLLTPTGYINAPLKDYSFLIGGGSVFSTAGDIYKFSEAVIDGKFGERVKSALVGQTAINSNGVHNGHRAYLKIEREKKWGYVLLSNLNSGANDLILQGLDAILQGREIAQPIIPKPVIVPNPNRNLSDFTGKYRREGNNEFEIFARNNSIYAGDTQLYPIKTDCFFEYRFYGNVCFVRDEMGKVKQVEWITPAFKSIGVKQ